jgi:hypothetical protein
MPQDPSDFRREDDFRNALYKNAKPSVVAKPKGRDTRITASSGLSGSFAQFPNRAAAVAELTRLKNYDPAEYVSDADGPFKARPALRSRDAWGDGIDSGVPIDLENKKARAMGFTSVVDYIERLRNAVDGYDKTLTKQKDYGTTALGGSNAKSYPSQGKMSKLMEEDLKKKGNR